MASVEGRGIRGRRFVRRGVRARLVISIIRSVCEVCEVCGEGSVKGEMGEGEEVGRGEGERGGYVLVYTYKALG